MTLKKGGDSEELKQEALDIPLRGTGFGRGHGLAVRQNID